MKYVIVYFLGILTPVIIIEWRTGLLWDWTKTKLDEWLSRIQKKLQ